MKKETYVKMTQPFRDDPKRARALHRANKILTVVIFVAYPCLLLWLLWQKDMRLYKAICVPLDGFIIVTVVRAWINRKRPYEIFELPSVIPKDTKGHSWPSRHVFSAAVIAFTFWFVCPAAGIVFLLMTVAIAWIRVVSGVHFISDVVAGFFFFFIPRIFFALRLQFFQAFIIEENAGIIESLHKSWEITKGQALPLFILALVMIGILILGCILFGIGIFVAVPLIYMMYGYVFRKLNTPLQILE